MTGSSGDSQGVGGSYMQLSAKIIANYKKRLSFVATKIQDLIMNSCIKLILNCIKEFSNKNINFKYLKVTFLRKINMQKYILLVHFLLFLPLLLALRSFKDVGDFSFLLLLFLSHTEQTQLPATASRPGQQIKK